MNTDSGATESSWMKTAEVPSFSPLTQNGEADVCIVGAGIAGLTTAYLLTQEGKRVIVLDDGPVAGGETSRTSAHLACEIDDGFVEIERIHGAEGARLAYESHAAAIDKIEEISRTENIDCDLRRVDAYLFTPPGESPDELHEELAAAHRAGFTSAEKVERAPIQDFDTGFALLFPNQAQFHPLKYMAGLAKAIAEKGGRIHTGTRVEKIGGGSPATVETADGHAVTAAAVVVATNSPINDVVKIHTKQAPYRTFMLGAAILQGSVETALYWDTLDPYHYVRVQSEQDGDILLIGGEDHKTGQEDDADQRYERLEAWARERWPMITEIKFRWSGQVMEPVDGLGFIGNNNGPSDTVYIATGDSGMGLTHGTIAGILLTDLICGRENEWAKLYDPSRKSLRAVGEWAKENANVASQYVDLVTAGDVKSPDEIEPGEGAVVRRGLSQIAVYKDESGATHECSAVCPHLGCIVAWNSEEKTWDCPCHGSRFTTDGDVVNGPAYSPLAPIETGAN